MAVFEVPKNVETECRRVEVVPLPEPYTPTTDEVLAVVVDRKIGKVTTPLIRMDGQRICPNDKH